MLTVRVVTVRIAVLSTLIVPAIFVYVRVVEVSLALSSMVKVCALRARSVILMTALSRTLNAFELRTRLLDCAKRKISKKKKKKKKRIEKKKKKNKIKEK